MALLQDVNNIDQTITSRSGTLGYQTQLSIIGGYRGLWNKLFINTWIVNGKNKFTYFEAFVDIILLRRFSPSTADIMAICGVVRYVAGKSLCTRELLMNTLIGHWIIPKHKNKDEETKPVYVQGVSEPLSWVFSTRNIQWYYNRTEQNKSNVTPSTIIYAMQMLNTFTSAKRNAL